MFKDTDIKFVFIENKKGHFNKAVRNVLLEAKKNIDDSNVVFYLEDDWLCYKPYDIKDFFNPHMPGNTKEDHVIAHGPNNYLYHSINLVRKGGTAYVYDLREKNVYRRNWATFPAHFKVNII